MHVVRHLIAQRHLAVLICAAALVLRLLVPAGYMIANDHGRIAVTLCSGMALPVMADGMHAMPGMAEHGKSAGHSKAEMPCAFAALSGAVLAAVDPFLLATLIAFVLATGLAAMVVPAPMRPAYLRPPMRGPPAHL